MAVIPGTITVDYFAWVNPTGQGYNCDPLYRIGLVTTAAVETPPNSLVGYQVRMQAGSPNHSNTVVSGATIATAPAGGIPGSVSSDQFLSDKPAGSYYLTLVTVSFGASGGLRFDFDDTTVDVTNPPAQPEPLWVAASALVAV